MIIRNEEEKDFKEVYTLVKKSFANAEHTDGNEHDLVEKLRKSDSLVLSLVAEIDKKIVGHIMFTKIKIGEREEVALAPLSVLPEYQKQGIGTKLIEKSHEILKNKNYEFSVVLGDYNFYEKSGYKKAEKFGIKPPFDIPSEYYLAINLQNKDTKLSETVQYCKEFL